MNSVEEYNAEMERIDGLGLSWEEQGYQRAPALCALADCTPEHLLQTLVDAQSDPCRPTSEDFIQQDIGAIRWCKEQLEKDNG